MKYTFRFVDINSSFRITLFLLSSEDLSNNTFAGGYYVSAESFGDSLLEIIDRVLHGEQAEATQY